jgi:hypothetical protein
MLVEKIPTLAVEAVEATVAITIALKIEEEDG